MVDLVVLESAVAHGDAVAVQVLCDGRPVDTEPVCEVADAGFCPVATFTPMIFKLERATDENSFAELMAMRDVAERGAAFRDTVVNFSDRLFVGGDPDVVYAFLHRADLWPDRVPHVARLDLIDGGYDSQLIEMDTRSLNGQLHATRSVRVCSPRTRVIVYKQTTTPDILATHLGRWTVRATEGGAEVIAEHTAVLRPERITAHLGEQASLEDARHAVRRALGANSLATLRCAKDAAERALA